MRKVRRFLAPVIGWGLILVMLVPMAERMRARYLARHSPVWLRFAEVLRTHRMRMHQNVLMAVEHTNDGGATVSFTLRDDATGQDWDCHCTFDKSRKLTRISVVAKP